MIHDATVPRAEREPCGNSLHDSPLPQRWPSAAAMADSRIAEGWTNDRCPDCGTYGWVKP